MGRAVDHALGDQAAAQRGDGGHLDAHPLGDFAGALGIGATQRHGPHVGLLARGEAVESNPEETGVQAPECTGSTAPKGNLRTLVTVYLDTLTLCPTPGAMGRPSPPGGSSPGTSGFGPRGPAGS